MHSAQEGTPEFHQFMRHTAEHGRNGDTLLAHITTKEAAKLKAAGGSGSINPTTGLPEFFADDGDEGQSDDAGEGSGESGTDGGSGGDSGGGGYGGGNSLSQGGFDYGNDSLGGLSDSIGTSSDDAASLADALSSYYDNTNVMDPDLISKSLHDIQNKSFFESIGGLFGVDQTLGVNAKGQVEVQNTLDVSPMSMLASLALGPIGSIGAKGLQALGYKDPTTQSYNFATNTLSSPYANAYNGAFGQSTAPSLSVDLTNTESIGDDLFDGSAQSGNSSLKQYTPQQIQFLTMQARNALSNGAFNNLLQSTTNPGLSDEEFNSIITSGIARESMNLGQNITREQFDARFNDPNLGNQILSDETNLRKNTFNSNLDNVFTGKAFGEPIDDDIINSVVDERAGPIRQQVGNLEARGNLNRIGGQNANDFLTEQENSARDRVRQEGDSILGGVQNEINTIRDTARTGIDNFKLGDDLFDITPFQEQRDKIVQDRTSSLGSDINTSLGSTPLFDISGALSSAGRAQGPVSGTGGNKSLLDAIAARETNSTSARRGVGTRGSGAF